jgi:hypothetical protein
MFYHSFTKTERSCKINKIPKFTWFILLDVVYFIFSILFFLKNLNKKQQFIT